MSRYAYLDSTETDFNNAKGITCRAVSSDRPRGRILEYDAVADPHDGIGLSTDKPKPSNVVAIEEQIRSLPSKCDNGIKLEQVST
jgi:hypothetical protein